MPKRALIEHRPYLFACLAAALGFYLLQGSALGGLWLILLKGAAVGSLSAYAYRRGENPDTNILALALALSALGDMGIEISLQLGGALFFGSHIAALALYLRNLREEPSFSQKALASCLVLAVPLICYLLSGEWQIAVYGVALGGMAATAWMSRFSRYRVGLGAILFVISDFLIFSRLGPLDLGPLPDLTIWPIYVSGQFLIATGVVQTFRKSAQRA